MKTISYILITLVILLFLYGAWGCDSCMKSIINTEGFVNEESTDYKNKIKEHMNALNSQSIENQKKLKKLLNSSNSNKEMNEDAKAILNS